MGIASYQTALPEERLRRGRLNDPVCGGKTLMSSQAPDAQQIDFAAAFQALTGNAPFPWQGELFRLFCDGVFPTSCNLPTGVGKTSVIAVWLMLAVPCESRSRFLPQPSRSRSPLE